MTKLALIIDKSQSYLDYQKEEVLTQWDLLIDDVQYVNSLSKVGETPLFGSAPPSVIQLDDPAQVKKLVAEFEKFEKDNEKYDLSSRLDSGLIILTTVARNSTRKLETIVSAYNGSTIFAKTNSKDRTNVAEKLLVDLHLKKEVKDFIIEYAGDDYENIIAIVKNLSTLSEKAQRTVNIEDMYIRMPLAPGSIPPWEIEKPLINGNIKETIEIYRRIVQHSHYLVVLSILKNKIMLAYRIGAVMERDPYVRSNVVAKALNMADNYPFKLAINLYKKIGFNKTESILFDLLETESLLKGGSSADNTVLMELFLVKTCLKLSK